MIKLAFSVLILIMIIGCGGTEYQVDFDGNHKIKFLFVHDHPYLAEYQKYVSVNGKRYYIGIDPGGQDAVHVYDADTEFIVVTKKCEWIKINKITLDVIIEQKEFSEVNPTKYYGKAGRTTDRSFKFILAKPDEYEAPFVLKGG